MQMNKKTSNLLFILAASFVVVFSLILISVNNWLKNSLKEEMVSQRPSSIAAPEEPKYKQAPIKPEAASVALESEQKSTKSAEPRKTQQKEYKQEPLGSPKVLTN